MFMTDKLVCFVYDIIYVHIEIVSWFKFYAPALKDLPGASSNRIVRLSVCPFVCLSVIPSRLQTKCNI